MKVSGPLLAFLVATLASATGLNAFADTLQGASRQRIGNYDFEMATEPKSVIAGQPTTIMLRFAGVNGDDLVDVPIMLRIVRDGTEILRTNPIIVPYGHHNFEFTFPEPGRYALYVNLNDFAYSGETLTFAFPINAAGPVDYLVWMLPVAGGIVAAVGAMIVIKRKRLAAKSSRLYRTDG
jgi:hypothetical protein